jgi:acetyl coenzyme A synthetase (ADP forming)-like protein
MAQRESRPEDSAESLRPMFQPRSVAVIGASRDPGRIGRRLFDAIVAGGFRGPVYPVNRNAEAIGNCRAYSSIRDVPGDVDLAVIAVPRDAVLPAAKECADRGVPALIVITAGFAETDDVGRRLQQQLLDCVRGHGMRMLGPNCLGLLSTDGENPLNALFVSVSPPAGNVAMSSDSGALGLAVLQGAARLGLGISACVSVGNRADVSSNDLLEYWEQDERSCVILLYLESFGNPRRFARIARRVARQKPIVAVKAGRTTAGQRAAGSHTAALATSDVAVDALFHQTGIIRAETLSEMFDLAAALSNQPLPAGNRVGVITNAGGPAILCTDACEAGHLAIPVLSPQTVDRLSEFLPAAANRTNPVDMIASAGPEQFRRAITTLLTSGEIDALVVIEVEIGMSIPEELDHALVAGVTEARQVGAAGRPVLVVRMPDNGVRSLHVSESESLPCYAFPEAAARVLSQLCAYSAWRRRDPGEEPVFADADIEAIRTTCRRAIELRGNGWLNADESRQVLTAMRLPVAVGGVATTADDAARLAAELGFPVALKLVSTTLVHKTEIGGVRLNLADEPAVRQAFSEIRSRLVRDGRLDAMEGVLVQPMLAGGTEVMVGAKLDPVFGPLIAFGLGGVHVEVLGDVCFRVAPLTDVDALEMIRGIRGFRLLEGYRGHAPADVPALKELLLRVSKLVENVPELIELDMNPVFALPPGQGCRIVDARLRVAAAR